MIVINGIAMDDGVDEPEERCQDDESPLGPEGCCFPGKCCMPGPHYESECHTPEMLIAHELEANPVSLIEAAGRPVGSTSTIHQYDAQACCNQIATLSRKVAAAEGMAKALKATLISANPHPMENGAMYAAWEDNRAALAAWKKANHPTP